MGCGGSKTVSPAAETAVQLEEYVTRPSTASAAKTRGDDRRSSSGDNGSNSGGSGGAVAAAADSELCGANIPESSLSKKSRSGSAASSNISTDATRRSETTTVINIAKQQTLEIDPEEYPGRAAHEAEIAGKQRQMSLTGGTIVSTNRVHGHPERSASRTPVEKGVCTECGRPVLDTEPRSKGPDGLYRHEPCPNGALDLANAAATGSKENAGTAATMAEVRAEATASIAKERATWDRATLSMSERMMRNAAARQRKSSSTGSMAPMRSTSTQQG